MLSFGAQPDAPKARCSGQADVLVREHSDAIERFSNSVLLTGEKIKAFLDSLDFELAMHRCPKARWPISLRWLRTSARHG